ncbi:MAG: CoA transferase, partial [Chloroflexi bacterium]|nr:CoA transferase [Chloroflexota bacterium]
PGSGDRARWTGPFFANDESAYFMSLNRGKKSITLNLQSPKGKEIFLSLVKQADVVVENFVPGTAKKLGIDYSVLKEVNPRLIYAAISGFGQTGPYAHRPALDVIVQGMGGIMSITGEPGRPPVRVGASVGDIAAGMFTAIGIVAAVHERSRSGLGQMLDVSMLDSQVAILENAFARYWATGEIPQPLGSRHSAATPFQAFQTRDGYIVVALMGGDPDPWPVFCSALDLVELIGDERFLDGWKRTNNYDVLEPILSEAMKKRTSQEWLQTFEELGIPCGPVNAIDRVASDPQVLHRGMVVDTPHPRLGTWKTVNSPLRLSRTPGQARGIAPQMGEHTEEILARFLGVTPQQVEALRRGGVV